MCFAGRVQIQGCKYKKIGTALGAKNPVRVQLKDEDAEPLEEGDEELEAVPEITTNAGLGFNIGDFKGWRVSYRRGRPEQHSKKEPAIMKRLIRKKHCCC